MAKAELEECSVASSRTARPAVVDLFAGAGGLSLGFEQAGFDVAAAVEYDAVHALGHKFNFPECRVLCRDVRQLAGSDLVRAAGTGSIDVIVGGPSCQGFSSMGQRQQDDERNSLLNEFVRLVCEARPRVFVLENVSGLLEPRFEKLRTLAWKSLQDAGYALSGTNGWLDAADFGVPQTRRRVVVVGHHDGPSIEVAPPAGIPRTTVRDALDGLPNIEDYEQLLAGDVARLHVRDVEQRLLTASPYARGMAGLAGRSDLARVRTWDPDLITNSLRTVHARGTVERFEATEQGAVEPISRFYRLHPDRPARTLRAGTGRERGAHTSPRPIHPTLPRVITVREAARLHGYPDWFRFAATNWHGHRQIGNSVPPPLARAIAAEVLAALGMRPRATRRVLPPADDSWLRTDPSAAAIMLNARADELPPQRKRRHRIRLDPPPLSTVPRQ